MGADPKTSSPFFFQKPPTSIVDTTELPCGSPPKAIKYPRMTDDYHYEAELVIGIGSSSTPSLDSSSAYGLITCIGVGCDLTRRDLQKVAKDNRRPWDDGKGVDDSGPIGGFYKVEGVGGWWEGGDTVIRLKVEGESKQEANINDMIWSPGEIVKTIAEYHDLREGDVIFTGTPEGVGKVGKGERVVCELEFGGLGRIGCDFICE